MTIHASMIPAHDDASRRLLRNAAILFTGQTGALALQFLAIVIAARALGTAEFGVLAVVQSYVMVWDRLGSFQSQDIVIRYGAGLMVRNENARLSTLLRLTILLDASGAILGAIFSVIAVHSIGSVLGLDQSNIQMAMLYSVIILFNFSGTPTGLLRLLNKFTPLSTYQVLIGLLKLLGAAAAWVTNASLLSFIWVWILSEVLGHIYLFAFAWTTFHKLGLRDDSDWSIWHLQRKFPGIISFIASSYLLSSVRMTTREFDTLIVTGILGTSGAGLYKVAKQFAGIIARAADPLYSAVYPELSRMVSIGDRHGFRRLMLRSALIAGGIGICVLFIITVLGDQLLLRLFGAQYVAAYGVLVAYSVAITIAMAGIPLQPAMLALGRPQTSLAVLTISTLVYFPILAILIQVLGLTGGGVAYIAFYLIWTTSMTIQVGRWVNRTGW